MHPACICHIQTETTTAIKGTHSFEWGYFADPLYANIDAPSNWMQGHPGGELNPAQPALESDEEWWMHLLFQKKSPTNKCAQR